jgi:hypothetical protein
MKLSFKTEEYYLGNKKVNKLQALTLSLLGVIILGSSVYGALWLWGFPNDISEVSEVISYVMHPEVSCSIANSEIENLQKKYESKKRTYESAKGEYYSKKYANKKEDSFSRWKNKYVQLIVPWNNLIIEYNNNINYYNECGTNFTSEIINSEKKFLDEEDEVLKNEYKNIRINSKY